MPEHRREELLKEAQIYAAAEKHMKNEPFFSQKYYYLVSAQWYSLDYSGLKDGRNTLVLTKWPQAETLIKYLWFESALRLRSITASQLRHRLKNRFLFLDSAQQTGTFGRQIETWSCRAQRLLICQRWCLGGAGTLRQYWGSEIRGWHEWWPKSWTVLPKY